MQTHQPSFASPSSDPPTLGADEFAQRIGQHLREVNDWHERGLIGAERCSRLIAAYSGVGRIHERETIEPTDVRRFPVGIALGALLLVAGAGILVRGNFDLDFLDSLTNVLALTPALVLNWLGLHCWRRGQLRAGNVFLTAGVAAIAIALQGLLNEFRG